MEMEELEDGGSPRTACSSADILRSLGAAASLHQAGADIIFDRCLGYIQEHSEQAPGEIVSLFNIRPSYVKVRCLQKRILESSPAEASAAWPHSDDSSPTEVAALLLQHLQLRPSSLIPPELYGAFLECCRPATPTALARVGGAPGRSSGRRNALQAANNGHSLPAEDDDGLCRMVISLDRLAWVLSRLPPANWRRLRGLLLVMHEAVQASSSSQKLPFSGHASEKQKESGLPDNATIALDFAHVLGPLLARPAGAVHMSIRHAMDLTRLEAICSSLITHVHDLMWSPFPRPHPSPSEQVLSPTPSATSTGPAVVTPRTASPRRSRSPSPVMLHSPTHLPLLSPPSHAHAQPHGMLSPPALTLSRGATRSPVSMSSPYKGVVMALIARTVARLMDASGPPLRGEVPWKCGRSLTHPECNAALLVLAGRLEALSLSALAIAPTHPSELGRSMSFSSKNDSVDASCESDWLSPVVCRHRLGLRSRAFGAAARRRLALGCRVLREQIKKFEEAQLLEHGHLPRGAERALLASTYAQYRVWKTVIREDAAVTIQRVLRWSFARCRRSRSPPTSPAAHPLPHRHVDAGDKTPTRGRRDQASTRISIHHDQVVQPHQSPPSAGEGPSASGSLVSGALSNDIATLVEKKRDIKARLKQFDTEFFATKGRMPTKSEKEPIRRYYELYNRIKSRIRSLVRLQQETQQKAARAEPRTVDVLDIDESGDAKPSAQRATGHDTQHLLPPPHAQPPVAPQEAKIQQSLSQPEVSTSMATSKPRPHSENTGHNGPVPVLNKLRQDRQAVDDTKQPRVDDDAALHTSRREDNRPVRREKQLKAGIGIELSTLGVQEKVLSAEVKDQDIETRLDQKLDTADAKLGFTSRPRRRSSTLSSTLSSSFFELKLTDGGGSGSTLSSDGGDVAEAKGGDEGVVQEVDVVKDLQTLKEQKKQLHSRLRTFEKTFEKEHGRKVSTSMDIQPVESHYRRYRKLRALIERKQQELAAGDIDQK